MKENLQKLKGFSFKIETEEIILKQVCRQNQSNIDQIFYSTNIENIICKIIDFENEISIFKFRKQKMLYQNLKNIRSVTKLIYSEELQYKKLKFGLLVFDKVLKNSSLVQQLTSLKQQSTILLIVKQILNFLIQMDSRSLVFLNIKPENIISNTTNSYSILNFQKVINTGLRQIDLKNNYFLNQSIESGFKYVSPEMFDTFSKEIIDWRTDIFCLGCLIFQLCYKKYPFSTPLALINISYFIPSENNECYPILNKIIQKCLVTANLRVKAKQILDQINNLESEKKKSKKQVIHQSHSNEYSNIIESSQNIFQQFKNALNKMTKQSQSWILNYTQQNQKQPDDKYINLLLAKVFKNRDKLQKIYNLVLKHTNARINSKNIIYKTLCLLFSFMRKGPKQIISLAYKNHLKQINDTIFRNYVNNGDILILEMCRINRLKYEFIQNYSEIFEGNFFLSKIENINKITLNIIQNFLKYLSDLLNSYQKIQNIKSLPNYIQNYYLDQIYDAAVTLIMLIICIQKDIQINKRKQIYPNKFNEIQSNLQRLLKQISQLLKTPKLHIITTLQSSIMNYKYSINFQFFSDIKVSVFQAFYKSEKIYMNLNLPSNISNQFLKSKDEGFGSNKSNENQNAKTKSNSTFLGEDSDEQKIQAQNQFNKIFESKQKQKPLKKSQIFQKVQKKQPNITNNKLFDLWNKQCIPQNKNLKLQNNLQLFKEFKQPTTPRIDFDAIWKVNNDVVLKQNPSKNKISFEQFDKITQINSSIKENNQNKEIISNNNDKPLKNNDKKQKIKKQQTSFCEDLLDLTIQDQFKKTQSCINQQIIHEFLVDNSNLKSKKLIQLQNDILKNLKQEKLKSLLKNSKLIIEYESITFNKIIGSGSAGQVYQGIYNNSLIAIKKIKSQTQNPNAFKQFQRQLITLIRIGKHQNLVSLIGISKKGEDYFLLMDYCQGGNLFQLLHRRTDLNINWNIRMSIIKQIVLAMNYLHSCSPQIIHRDLKSLNILIKNKFNPSDDKINIKVTDFGLSRNPDAQFMTSALGTLHWMAPELLQGKNYSLKVDIYSFGVVLWEICSRETPYKQFRSPHSIMKYVVMQSGRPNLNKLNNGCPQKLRNLMIKCWNLDEGVRPDFKQILKIL